MPFRQSAVIVTVKDAGRQRERAVDCQGAVPTLEYVVRKTLLKTTAGPDMKRYIVIIIYAVGLLPLFFLYQPLKEMLSSMGFVAAAIVYLLALRLLAEHMAERYQRRDGPNR